MHQPRSSTGHRLGSVVVRITLGKFKEISSVAGQHNDLIDTTADNLWNKKISGLGFNLYLYDKNKVRIGDGWITIENVPRGQSVKFQTRFMLSARPYWSNWLLTRCPLNRNRSPRRKRQLRTRYFCLRYDRTPRWDGAERSLGRGQRNGSPSPSGRHHTVTRP
jgi:hypothetical protein